MPFKKVISDEFTKPTKRKGSKPKIGKPKIGKPKIGKRKIINPKIGKRKTTKSAALKKLIKSVMKSNWKHL